GGVQPDASAQPSAAAGIGDAVAGGAGVELQIGVELGRAGAVGRRQRRERDKKGREHLSKLATESQGGQDASAPRPGWFQRRTAAPAEEEAPTDWRSTRSPRRMRPSWAA